MVDISDRISGIKDLSRKLRDVESTKDKEYRRLQALNKIIVKSNESVTQRELLNSILDSCISFINFDIGGIYILRDGTASLSVTVFIPEHIKEELNFMCKDRPELVEVFSFGKPLHLNRYDETHPKVSQTLGGIKTLVIIPILHNNTVRGCINLGSYKDVTVSDENCGIIRTLGKHLGHVLYRVEIEEKLRSTVDKLNVIVEKYEVSQQALDLERNNLYMLFNKMSDMLFVISKDGIILSINDAVRERLQYPNGNLIGKPVSVIYNFDDVTSVMKDLYNDEQRSHTMKLIAKDGSEVLVGNRAIKGLWNGQEVRFWSSHELKD
jgi:PAS domain S-box-containing protein